MYHLMKLDRCECTNFLAVEYMAVDVTCVTGLDVTGMSVGCKRDWLDVLIIVILVVLFFFDVFFSLYQMKSIPSMISCQAKNLL